MGRETWNRKVTREQEAYLIFKKEGYRQSFLSTAFPDQYVLKRIHYEKILKIVERRVTWSALSFRKIQCRKVSCSGEQSQGSRHVSEMVAISHWVGLRTQVAAVTVRMDRRAGTININMFFRISKVFTWENLNYQQCWK